MLFNSSVFLVFFAVVFAAYWLLHRDHRRQNALLLVASYVFYAGWDWRFCSLLALSTAIDFSVGRGLHRTEDPKRRRALLLISIVANLGFLGLFKYFNFFAESFAELLSVVGFAVDPISLRIVLPLGISFYTFQTLSYTIDVYRRHLEPSDNLPEFALFVAFFPQLVAGPIERATRLLPQIAAPRTLAAGKANAGVFLIVWGYFKKVVVADNLAPISNEIFDNYPAHDGLSVVLGVLAFTGQIYCDFSGYSDIARGLAKLLGFELMVNFRLPYFAISPSDFWRRWHISLSTWLRDYLYIPLGGNRGSPVATQRSLVLTMLLGGLWHGAAWHFVVWGAYHGLLLIVYRAFEQRSLRRERTSRRDRFLILPARMGIMFVFTIVGWLIFRAESTEQIVHMLGSIHVDFDREDLRTAYELFFFVAPIGLMQLAQRRSGNLLVATKLPPVLQGVLLGWMLVWILTFGVRTETEFIYFQF